jgi:hypothetical protein
MSFRRRLIHDEAGDMFPGLSWLMAIICIIGLVYFLGRGVSGALSSLGFWVVGGLVWATATLYSRAEKMPTNHPNRNTVAWSALVPLGIAVWFIEVILLPGSLRAMFGLTGQQ